MKSTLILLPGLMCDSAVWAPQVQQLTDLADCVIADYGMCDSLADMAQQVLAGAPAGRFALAGHSMGGRVALEVIRLAPDRVERLALLDTGIHQLPLGDAGEKEKSGRMALVELAQQKGMRAMGRQWLPGMVHPDVLGTRVFDAVLDMLERSSPDQFAAQIKALICRPDAAPVLSTIRCPTLVLTGEQDMWSPPAQHAAMAEAISCARLSIIEHCGHMATLEQPLVVGQAMRQWLLT